MRRVLVTRPAGQEGSLRARLAQAGIRVLAVPTVAIRPAQDGEMERLLFALDRADWLVITSANGARALRSALAGRSLPATLRSAAVGPATAAAWEEGGLAVHAMPDRYLTVAIADALGDVAGRRVVLARADAATPQLRDALVVRGALVEEFVAYRTVEGPAASSEPLRDALREEPDAVLFSSGSTVRGLQELLPPLLYQRMTRVPAVCIGPVTATAARQAGFTVVAVAREHTSEGLARATIDYLDKEAS